MKSTPYDNNNDTDVDSEGENKPSNDTLNECLVKLLDKNDSPNSNKTSKTEFYRKNLIDREIPTKNYTDSDLNSNQY